MERVEPKIKKYLTEHGLSQRFIAQQIGMAPSKLSWTLNGKRKISIEEYFQICQTLGVGVNTFFEE